MEETCQDRRSNRHDRSFELGNHPVHIMAIFRLETKNKVLGTAYCRGFSRRYNLNLIFFLIIIWQWSEFTISCNKYVMNVYILFSFTHNYRILKIWIPATFKRICMLQVLSNRDVITMSESQFTLISLSKLLTAAFVSGRWWRMQINQCCVYICIL